MTTTTTLTPDHLRTQFRCECCPRMLRAPEAQGCRIALQGRVLCWQCRRREFPTFAVPHQVPPGFRALGRWSGYGMPEVTLTRTVDGTTWIGTGPTVERCLANARFQARRDGASV